MACTSAYTHKHMSEDTYSVAWMISRQHPKILSSLLQVSRSEEDTFVLSPAGNLLCHTFLRTCTCPHFRMFQWKVSLQNHHVCRCVHPFEHGRNHILHDSKVRNQILHTQCTVSMSGKLIFHDCSYLRAFASVLVQSFIVQTHTVVTQHLPLNFFSKRFTIARCSDAEDFNNSLAV